MTGVHAAQLLSEILQNSRFGVAVLGEDGAVHLWSQGAQRILGWAATEVPCDTARQLQQASAIDSAAEPQHLPVRTADGQDIDIEIFAGSPVHGLIVFAEAGERQLAQLQEDMRGVNSQMRQMQVEIGVERRFRELLEAAPDAIIEVDGEGRIQLVNRATEALFGYPREELRGQKVELLVPQASRAAHSGHRTHYAAHPSTRPMGSGLRLEGQRRDGATFPVEISLSPVSGGDGDRITAVIRDTTERRLAETQMREMHEAYARELETRNREVERANQLKSEFLASMSHELRTPLHTIIGFAELLSEQLQETGQAKHLRFLRHIHTDSMHLLALINDVLDISKIESGKLELRPQVFDLQEAFSEALSSIRSQGAAKSIAIESGPVPVQAVLADRLRFKQILFNLLSNAVKFTPEGGKITLETSLARGFLKVSVSDTGIGIPADQLETVFEKFYQVGATTKGVREGTGLGLAITKALVAAHGGQISVVSEPGIGSRFTFTIAVEAGS